MEKTGVITVMPGLVTLHRGVGTCKVPIEITNTTSKPVTIHPKTRIATVLHASSIVDTSSMPRSDGCTTNAKDLFDLSTAPLDEGQREKVVGLLDRMPQVFATRLNDLGRTTDVEHEINVTDKVPFKETYRRVAPGQMEEFRQASQDLLDAEVITESKSPYASPVVIVRKRDNCIRLCVDFRKLNARTIKDSYPIPRVTEILQALSGSKYFCTLDLQSGYLQVQMAERDRPKTAMTTPLGLYEFNRMPFGLTNAPATFQRLMEHCLKDLNFKKCVVYIDDVHCICEQFQRNA